MLRLLARNRKTPSDEEKASRPEKNKPSVPKIPIHEQIENTFKAVGEIYGLDCVPFIGTTGAGKSTSINALLGHQLEGVQHQNLGSVFRVKLGSKDLDGNSWSANIGHSFVSETIYPKGYKISTLPFSYCDSPGLAENRRTYLLPTILGRSLLLALPRKISGIVVVIDFKTIEVGRGLLLKQTLKEVRDFFNKANPSKGEARESSVLYVFTHMPDYIPQSKGKGVIVNRLKKLLKDEQSKTKSDQDVFLVKSCEIVLKYPENIFPIYPVNDKIHSKAAILKRLCQLDPINKRLLRDFNSQNEISLVKNEVIPIVKTALDTFKKIEQAENEKRRINDEMVRLKRNMKSMTDLKEDSQKHLKETIEQILQLDDGATSENEKVENWETVIQQVKLIKETLQKQEKSDNLIKNRRKEIASNEKKINCQDRIITEQKYFLKSKRKVYESMRNFLIFVTFTIGVGKEEDRLFILFKKKFDAYYPTWRPTFKPYENKKEGIFAYFKRKIDTFSKKDAFQEDQDHVNRIDFKKLFSKHQVDTIMVPKVDNKNLSQAVLSNSDVQPISAIKLKNNKAQQKISQPEVEQKQDGFELIKRLWEEEAYAFKLQRKGKILLIKLTNAEDLGKTQDVLAKHFSKLKEDLEVIFNKKLGLTVGKSKDVTIKSKFSAKTVEVHVQHISSIDRLIHLFVKEGLIEKDQANSPGIECVIL